jgi:hypothetical protein
MRSPSLHVTFDNNMKIVSVFYGGSTDQQEQQLREVADLMIAAIVKDEEGARDMRPTPHVRKWAGMLFKAIVRGVIYAWERLSLIPGVRTRMIL